MVTTFFTHPTGRPIDATEFYAHLSLQKAQTAARRTARKRIFSKKPAVGWGWKRGIFSLTCPCGNATAVDHRRCRRLRKNMKERKKGSYIPRGIDSSLRDAAKEFHEKRPLLCKELTKEEMVNKIFVKENSIKESPICKPLSEKEKEFIKGVPDPRTEPKAPADENCLLLKWRKTLHPILQDIPHGPFSEPPRKARQGAIGKIIKKYGKKEYINKKRWKDTRCYVCTRLGHIAAYCDNRPTLRKMGNSIEELFLNFWTRQKQVVWTCKKSKLEELIRSIPQIIERIERIAEKARIAWGRMEPFGKEWSFPRLIRKASFYYYALGTSPMLITKAIAGDFNRYISPPERKEYPNHPSVYENMEYMNSHFRDLVERGIAIPIPPKYAKVVLPMKVVDGKKKRLVINGIPLNPHTPYTSFHLPSITCLSSLITHKGMKALYFDFKDAFYQGSVTPENALEQCVRWKHPIDLRRVDYICYATKDIRASSKPAALYSSP